MADRGDAGNGRGGTCASCSTLSLPWLVADIVDTVFEFVPVSDDERTMLQARRINRVARNACGRAVAALATRHRPTLAAQRRFSGFWRSSSSLRSDRDGAERRLERLAVVSGALDHVTTLDAGDAGALEFVLPRPWLLPNVQRLVIAPNALRAIYDAACAFSADDLDPTALLSSRAALTELHIDEHGDATMASWLNMLVNLLPASVTTVAVRITVERTSGAGAGSGSDVDDTDSDAWLARTLRRLQRAPHVASLTASGDLDVASLPLLLAAFPGVRHLACRQCGVVAFRDASVVPKQLEALELEAVRLLTCDALHAFLAPRSPQTLRKLRVAHWVSGPSAPVSVASLAALCDALEELDILGTPNDAASAVIGRIAPLRRLVRLRLSGPDLTDVDALMVARNHPGLADLALLHSHALTDDGVKSLAAGLPHLTSLDLGHCRKLGDPAAAAISAALPGLRELTIGGLRLGVEGLRALGGLQQLVALDVWKCCAEDDGIDALVRCGESGHCGERLQQLQRLRVATMGTITPAVIPLLAQLRSLHHVSCTRKEGWAFSAADRETLARQFPGARLSIAI